jgi:phage shock protein E
MKTTVTWNIVVALLLLGALAASPCFAAGVKNISSAQAQALLAKDKKIVLLDVRTPEEFRQARLHGAQLIPIAELEKRLGEIPRDRPLLVYCSVGARSASAAAFLASRGFREIYQISDGLVGWYKNGFPIER